MLILRKLGIRGSRAAKRRIFFNLVLIALVTSALVFAQIFVVSMSKGIADKYALLGNGHLQVHGSPTSGIPDLPGILDIQEVEQSFALIYSPQANKMVRLKGVGENYFNQLRRAEITIEEASDAGQTSLPQVMISTTLAKTLDVKPLDRIALMLVNNSNLRPQLCVVKSLFSSGYKELDENLMFCDAALVKRLFGGEADMYQELLVEESQLDSIKNELKAQGLAVTSWDEENYSVATNLDTSRQAILGVMLAVAILCGYFISELSRELVEDDKHSIAMLKLLGSPAALVRKVYFSTVMLVTFIAIAIGSLLGVALSLNLAPLLSFLAKANLPSLSFYLLDFATIIPLSDLALILFVLFSVGALSVAWSLRRIKGIELLSCTHFD